MFNKILVAIDGSKMSDKVLNTAKQIASNMDAELTIIFVGKEIKFPPEVVITDLDTVIEEIRKIGIDLLEEAKAKISSDGLVINTAYKEGNAARQIVDYACKENYDLIVIGSRGLGNIKEMMLGSVSHKVSQLSDRPVLIVK